MAYSADLCGSKLRGKLGGVLNESATTFSPALLSSDKSFAKRQLEKMGWTEGTGLGKRRDGMKEHVKIKQREDEMGLGREKMKAQEVADVWWKDSVGNTLAKLQKKKSAKDEKKKKKSKKEKKCVKKERKMHFTDEELFEATGGARFGMRAQRRAEGKWKRTESGHELTELEDKAKASMEWNGRGNAQVLISKESSTTLEGERDVGNTKMDADFPPLRSKEVDSEKEVGSGTYTKNEYQSKKKKRKSEKKESKRDKKAKTEKDDDGIREVSPPASEEEEIILQTEEEKKRAKKDKKKKSKSITY